MLIPIPDSLRQEVLAAYSQGTLAVADSANRLLGIISPMDDPISPPGSTNGSSGSTNELVLSTILLAAVFLGNREHRHHKFMG
jgi:hypothetical protein